MPLTCNQCRAEISGNYPVHSVDGFALCDLCADMLKAVASRVHFVRAQCEYVIETARKRMMLRGE